MSLSSQLRRACNMHRVNPEYESNYTKSLRELGETYDWSDIASTFNDWLNKQLENQKSVAFPISSFCKVAHDWLSDKNIKTEDKVTNKSDASLYTVIIKEVAKADGYISYKSAASIKNQLSDSDWTEEEIRRAVLKILQGMDDFTLKRAGEYIDVRLAAEIELHRDYVKQIEQTRKEIEEVTIREQARVERELEELRKAELPEEL